jgi:HEPN domain-containing protein
MARTQYQGVSEQAKASKHRLDDARVLFNGARWRGSMYMAGYAAESLLKVKLMRMFSCNTLTDLETELRARRALPADGTIFTHKLELLMELTGAKARLNQRREQWEAFNTVNRWVEAWRYTADLSNREDAEDFLDAVAVLVKWIETNV